MNDQPIEHRAMDLIEAMASDLKDALAGPGAEAALGVYKADALSAIVGGGFSLVILVALIYAAVFLIKTVNIKYARDELPFQLFIGGITMVFFFFFLIFSFDLIDPFNWIQLFHPEIGLARDVLESLK